MKALVVGDGGREHAIAWKLLSSPSVSEVLVAPGNAGTASMERCRNVQLGSQDELFALARDEGVDLTVVGPEAHLVSGIADLFRAGGARIVGPSKAAAALEASKSFAKQFCARMQIPAPQFGVFEDAELAAEFMRQMDPPYVIKADGLAAGKGVAICATHEEASRCAGEMLGGKFGDASETIVVEEHLRGEELSYFVLADGEHFARLGSGRDYKRLYDGGEGPNTGGMGAVSPAPALTPELEERILGEIVAPTIRGMKGEGCPYTGFLYLGLMVCDGAPLLLEYNCRLGDPECQALLPRLRSDFAQLLLWSAGEGGGEPPETDWDGRSCAGVVMATQGYATDAVRSGVIPKIGRGLVFHAKTKAAEDGEGYSHAGGRALCAVGMGDGVEEACRRAYDCVGETDFPDCQYRKDIGSQANA